MHSAVLLCTTSNSLQEKKEMAMHPVFIKTLFFNDDLIWFFRVRLIPAGPASAERLQRQHRPEEPVSCLKSQTACALSQLHRHRQKFNALTPYTVSRKKIQSKICSCCTLDLVPWFLWKFRCCRCLWYSHRLSMVHRLRRYSHLPNSSRASAINY